MMIECCKRWAPMLHETRCISCAKQLHMEVLFVLGSRVDLETSPYYDTGQGLFFLRFGAVFDTTVCRPCRFGRFIVK